MAYPRRYWVKLKVPKRILVTLPDFPTPISKTRLKKISAEERRNALAAAAAASLNPSGGTSGLLNVTTGVNSASPSKLSSPAPSETASISVNSTSHKNGPREPSTAGLTMNAITNNSASLDRTGKRVRKWTRKKHSFKTFTGFTVERVTWRTEMESSLTDSTTPHIKTEA